MKYILFISFFIALFFSACSSSGKIASSNLNKEPSWINDPYLNDGKIRSVGCARRHYKGMTYQKKLALSNAIDEIATQLNTTVENIAIRKKSYSNGSQNSSSLNESSLHSVDKTNLSISIKDYYKKDDDEICVWVEKTN